MEQDLGSVPTREAVQNLGIQTMEDKPPAESSASEGNNPFSALIPWLAGISGGSSQLEKAESKPSRYLVAKGLPTLPMKLVEKVWNLEYVDMEEFLPAPPIPEIIIILSNKAADMVPSMVAHLHTVLRLQQKASSQLEGLKYDILFRMKLAASVDRSWTVGDPWQYVSCLPVPLQSPDPFEVAELEVPAGGKSKGKRPAEQEADKSSRQPLKKVQKGVCQLHNTAPNGCPYGKECIFLHRCSGCGVVNEHGRTTCPKPGQAAAQNSQAP